MGTISCQMSYTNCNIMPDWCSYVPPSKEATYRRLQPFNIVKTVLRGYRDRLHIKTIWENLPGNVKFVNGRIYYGGITNSEQRKNVNSDIYGSTAAQEVEWTTEEAGWTSDKADGKDEMIPENG